MLLTLYEARNKGKLRTSHATHPFGVRAVGLHHFAPFGDALAYGQLAKAMVVPFSFFVGHY